MSPVQTFIILIFAHRDSRPQPLLNSQDSDAQPSATSVRPQQLALSFQKYICHCDLIFPIKHYFFSV